MTQEISSARSIPQQSAYPHQVRDIIRYGDMDAQNHVNNVVIVGYFESGRVALFREPGLGLSLPGRMFVLGHLDISFVRELHWPGEITIGTGVARIGRSSFGMAQAVFHEGACVAHGVATIVLVDLATRKSTPVPDDFRDQLGQWTMR